MTENENKRKFALWVRPQTLKSVEEVYRQDNCASKSEFIEKAINFYTGYLATERGAEFLAAVIPQTMRGIVKSTEDRLSRLQFKQAVELAKIVRMIAPLCEVDEAELHNLHIDCVDEVKRINGIMKLDIAIRGDD